MNYFGLSNKVVELAQQELNSQKQELTNKNYFSEETLKILHKNQDLKEADSEEDKDKSESSK